MIEIPITSIIECIVYGGLLLTALTYVFIVTVAAIRL